jgi:hypothetical protein
MLLKDFIGKHVSMVFSLLTRRVRMPEKDKERESYYFSYFKKLYESWEKSTSQVLEVWLKNLLLKDNMEKAFEKSVEFKNYIQDIMEKTLKHRYFPSKNDMNKLTSSLYNLEEKLNKLEEKINELQSTRESTPESKKGKPKSRRKKNESRKV